MTLRVAFMGTPAFAVPALEAIAAAGHEVVAAYTKAPNAAGRGLRERRSPVHETALRLGIPVLTPRSLRGPASRPHRGSLAPPHPEVPAAGELRGAPQDEEAGSLGPGSPATAFRALGADVAVVVAYGLILPPAILAAPRHGCLNLHASLLPRWRGAAPIHRAVMAGDPETGIAVMRMEEGLDTGPVALEAGVAIDPDATTGELHDELARLGAALAVKALARLEAGTLRAVPQPEAGILYAPKIANEEARIRWEEPAGRVHDQVRGLSPWPGAFFEADLGTGRPERVKVLRTEKVAGSGPPGRLLDGRAVTCGWGAVRPLVLQRAGRGPVAAEAFWRGVRLGPGARLG